ncbi:MAG: outer membrane protein assembly factor BamA [Alphaproteobacteria bacterium]|nr:outer membrane protein assembly factor BamA [Alphaproteobacteria bacterium]
MKSILYIIIFLLINNCLFYKQVFAQNPVTIGSVRIEGTQRIEPNTVRSYMQLEPGQSYETSTIDQALKNLYATGLFADVNISLEGDILVVKVKENPIINRLAFEGNNHIDDDTLEAEVQLKPRVVYTQTRVQADAKRIQDIYRRSGRFAATVDPKVIQLDQNRIDLVFEINEGDKTSVKRIDFVGNNVFGDSELRKQIITHEAAWYRFLTTNDTYDPDRLTVDREVLRNFYLKNGYADFRVVSAVAELSPEKDSFYITFTVEEGERYQFNTVDIKSDIKELDPKLVEDQILTKPNTWYDASLVDKTVAILTESVGNLGYAFAEIRPRIEKNQEEHQLDLVYEIQEGERVYLERIDINGNVRTLDKVIRREFRLVEGDAFNASKMRRTKQRIQNLGFFSKVDLKTNRGSTPDKTVVEVNVEEQSTGELNLGLGFSTADGPLADVGLRERNFLGRGQDLRADFSISGKRSLANLSFTDPYFLEEELTAGVDIFRTTTERKESSFEKTTTGAGIRLGYDISEYLRHNIKYTLSYDEIDNIKGNVSEAIKQQEGKTLSSVISQDIILDRRDNRFDPNEGYLFQFSNDFAGLAGSIHYLRTEITGGYWEPIMEDVTLGFSGKLGYIFGLGEEVRVTDAFFLGGNNFRGFKTAGIGPRDTDTDDALGGNVSFVGTAELSFPLGLPEEYQIRGRAFTDFGTLFDSDFHGSDVEDSAAPRISIGGGLTWRSPFGPLAVDLGLPIVKESYDVKELFRFSLGTRF